MILHKIMINMTETTMSQNSIREEVEILRDILFDDRVKIVKSLRDLVQQFDHNIENANILLSVLDKKSVDFAEIDTTSEIDYLVRDHDVFSNTIRNINNLKKFQKTLQRLHLFQKELDY